LSRAVEQSPASIVITDTKGSIEYVNPKFTQVTGYTLEEAIGKNPRILKTDQTPEEVHRQLWEAITSGKEWRGEFVNRKKNGELYYETASISPITENHGNITHYLAVKEDITQWKQGEAKLQYLNDRLRTLQNITFDLLNRHKMEDVLNAILLRASNLLESPFGLLTILDGDMYVVRATTEMTASQIGERAASQNAHLSSLAIKTRQTQVIHDYSQWSERLRIHDPYQLKAVADVPILINEIAVGVIALGRTEPGKPYINEDVQVMDSLAQLAALAIDNAQLFATAQNELAEKIHAEEDLRRANQTLQLQLEAIEQLQTELREQAIRDPLTGLYNRRYLNETLERELARAMRENYQISFVMIDIDHFKKINDTFGHGTGDVVLQKLATQLLGQTRIVDIVCRYGGEEFLIILPNVTAAIAFQITERWRKSFMGMTMPLGYSSIQTTISCGISVFPLDGNTGEELISNADKAMYQAKAAGRNRVVVWQNEMNG
jgi:diguanylate cyclase (GGDEF)-like protein/PAS domain S-box-containing protein